MPDAAGFTCRCCGEYHRELPMSFGAQAPVYWSEELAGREDSELNCDLCIITAEHFFVYGLIEIPVRGADEPFTWGVWVSLSKPNFVKTVELIETEGREAEPPYFGWLSTELPIYPTSTVRLKTNVHTRPVGLRPTVQLEPTDHPLAVEQRMGITLERVQEIAEQLLHPAA